MSMIFKYLHYDNKPQSVNLIWKSLMLRFTNTERTILQF